jgi:hypothetical protein
MRNGLRRYILTHMIYIRAWKAVGTLRIAASLAIFSVAVVLNFLAGLYATDRASNPVADIILSNTHAFDVDGLFVYGTITFIAFAVVLVVSRPRTIPYTLDALAVFFFIRAAFVSMTHIAPYPIHTDLSAVEFLAQYLGGGADLFFSGHTGSPFLLALVYWRETALRYAFLAWSVFFATVVLLGHLHYTIDVASAFFITYTISHIARWLFPRDHELSEPGAVSIV